MSRKGELKVHTSSQHQSHTEGPKKSAVWVVYVGANQIRGLLDLESLVETDAVQRSGMERENAT